MGAVENARFSDSTGCATTPFDGSGGGDGAFSAAWDNNMNYLGSGHAVAVKKAADR